MLFSCSAFLYFANVAFQSIDECELLNFPLCSNIEIRYYLTDGLHNHLNIKNEHQLKSK